MEKQDSELSSVQAFIVACLVVPVVIVGLPGIVVVTFAAVWALPMILMASDLPGLAFLGMHVSAALGFAGMLAIVGHVEKSRDWYRSELEPRLKDIGAVNLQGRWSQRELEVQMTELTELLIDPPLHSMFELHLTRLRQAAVDVLEAISRAESIGGSADDDVADTVRTLLRVGADLGYEVDDYPVAEIEFVDGDERLDPFSQVFAWSLRAAVAIQVMLLTIVWLGVVVCML